MILKTTENQKGEHIPEHEIAFTGGRWYERRLSCYSAESEGMGICQCISHPTFMERKLSREEVKHILETNILLLSEEEREDLIIDSFEEKVKEDLYFSGYTINHICQWLKDCYTLGLNPLPALRKLLPYARIEFAYANGGTIPLNTGNEDTIFVIVSNPEGIIEDVGFAIVPI